MGYLGLVPGERSTGESVRRFGIAKPGNGRVRRTLIEGAWTTDFTRCGRHCRCPMLESVLVRWIGLGFPFWLRCDSSCWLGLEASSYCEALFE